MVELVSAITDFVQLFTCDFSHPILAADPSKCEPFNIAVRTQREVLAAAYSNQHRHFMAFAVWNCRLVQRHRARRCGKSRGAK